MAARGLFGDLAERSAFDRRRGAEEIRFHERARETDRVEYLRAAIGLIGRDAHLRHDLEQAFVDGLDEALDDFVGAHRLGQVLGHRGQRLEREVGIDRLGAIAGKARKMMHFARFASLQDETDRSTQALADEMMVNRGGREQRGNRNAVGTDHAVGEDDDVVAAMDRRLRPLAQALQRFLHAGRPTLDGVGDVERLGVEGILEMADAADLLEILVGQDRLPHLEPLASRIAFEVEEIRPRPDERDEAHDELLADRIDRRVRHLREVLLEIGVEQLRLVG